MGISLIVQSPRSPTAQNPKHSRHPPFTWRKWRNPGFNMAWPWGPWFLLIPIKLILRLRRTGRGVFYEPLKSWGRWPRQNKTSKLFRLMCLIKASCNIIMEMITRVGCLEQWLPDSYFCGNLKTQKTNSGITQRPSSNLLFKFLTMEYTNGQSYCWKISGSYSIW